MRSIRVTPAVQAQGARVALRAPVARRVLQVRAALRVPQALLVPRALLALLGQQVLLPRTPVPTQAEQL